MRIAIDGPAGAGKSTIARLVAAELGYKYIDTGAMYRALTFAALKENIPLDDGDLLVAFLQKMDMEIVPSERGNMIYINGENVAQLIRQPSVTKHVSQVASHNAVRTAMVKLQQQIAAEGNVVMDGRDIGTVVIPDADLKIYLNASETERAQRRQKELVRTGYEVSLEELEEEIRNRDYMDMTRAVSPLQKADEAIEIDTTNLSINEVAQLILGYSKQGR